MDRDVQVGLEGIAGSQGCNLAGISSIDTPEYSYNSYYVKYYSVYPFDYIGVIDMQIMDSGYQ